MKNSVIYLHHKVKLSIIEIEFNFLEKQKKNCLHIERPLDSLDIHKYSQWNDVSCEGGALFYLNSNIQTQYSHTVAHLYNTLRK